VGWPWDRDLQKAVEVLSENPSDAPEDEHDGAEAAAKEAPDAEHDAAFAAAVSGVEEGADAAAAAAVAADDGGVAHSSSFCGITLFCHPADCPHSVLGVCFSNTGGVFP